MDVGELLEFLMKVNDLFPIPLSAKISLDEFARKLQKQGTVEVLRENNEIIALVAGYINDLKTQRAYISVLVVLPMFQGKGYSSMLMNAFCNKAKKNDMKEVFLHAHKSNQKAIRLYERLGFMKFDDDTRPNDFLFKKDL